MNKTPHPGWKNVRTAPHDNQRILLFREGWAECTCVGYYLDDYEGFVSVGGAPFEGVTHWMPIPNEPR